MKFLVCESVNMGKELAESIKEVIISNETYQF